MTVEAHVCRYCGEAATSLFETPYCGRCLRLRTLIYDTPETARKILAEVDRT